MLKVGLLLSPSKGFLDMGKEAVKYGANTFQFFTRSPRKSVATPINMSDIAQFIEFSKENNFHPILGHAPYLINPCSDNMEARSYAKAIMADDLSRLENIPGSYYVLHPGSHVGQGVEVGTRYTIELLNDVINSKQSTTVLLETMAGKGDEIGRSFEELRLIIDGVNLKNHIGICLDTCHIFDAGYDIKNDLHTILSDFDRIIGFNYLKAIHISDSKGRIDRHEKIGEGSIGSNAFKQLINHTALRELPFYLETPNDKPGHIIEIRRLKSWYKRN